jgi:predicted glycogen debranching enzyme
MLPNCFPESGQAPQYNTVDAALWFIEAVARYIEATGDLGTLRTLWPALTQIVTFYCRGTRYGIHVDVDGLVSAGAPGMQLTWMDAKTGDRVVTPRSGKPVEIAALWYNGLHRMALLAAQLGESTDDYHRRAAAARDGFQRFWNAASGSCYDVLDGPGGNDATLRPNQIFAVALPYAGGGPAPLLSRERQQAVVTTCAAQLVTSNGLRTLSPADPSFVGRYDGPPAVRDACYHQGTAWAWLLGPFAVAHARAFGDAARARSFLQPLADQLYDYGLGSIAEIADGSAPFRPRGAIAQAWSIGELLRAWYDVEE